MNLIKNISKKLAGNGAAMAEYEKALQALKDAASKVSDEAELQVSLVDRSEIYSTTNKAIKDIRNLENTYSHQALQREPKLAVEYAEVAEALLVITKVTGARRRENAKFRDKQAKRFEKHTSSVDADKE